MIEKQKVSTALPSARKQFAFPLVAAINRPAVGCFSFPSLSPLLEKRQAISLLFSRHAMFAEIAPHRHPHRELGRSLSFSIFCSYGKRKAHSFLPLNECDAGDNPTSSQVSPPLPHHQVEMRMPFSFPPPASRVFREKGSFPFFFFPNGSISDRREQAPPSPPPLTPCS